MIIYPDLFFYKKEASTFRYISIPLIFSVILLLIYIFRDTLLYGLFSLQSISLDNADILPYRITLYDSLLVYLNDSFLRICF